MSGDDVAAHREAWAGVRRAQAMVQTNTLGAFAQGAFVSHEFANFAHSLVLIFAFAVLNDVLDSLRADGRFDCGRREVGALMHASRSSLPWSNYALVDEARDVRNDVAHRGRIVARDECWLYINAVEDELIGWGVLDGRMRADYTIEIGPAS